MSGNQGRRTGRNWGETRDPTVPHWSSLRCARRGVVLPPIPPKLSWRTGLPAQLPIMLNGPTPGDPNAPILGDCTQVGLRRLRTVWTYQTTKVVVNDPDDLVEQGYSESTGYVKGDPSTDRGGTLQRVLKWAMTDGMPIAGGGRDKSIIGFIQIDPRHPDDVRRAIAECGGVYAAGDLPASFMDVNPGDAWRVAGPGVEGHCTPGTGYDGDSIDMDTWGFSVPTTEAAVEKYWDEIYAVISQDFIDRTGKTPFGMSMADVWATLGPLQMSAAAGA